MENNNGKGIFYGVIGVATLIVAIIGATFAYFTATQTASEYVQGAAATAGLNVRVMRMTGHSASEPSYGEDSEGNDKYAYVMVPQLDSTLDLAVKGVRGAEKVQVNDSEGRAPGSDGYVETLDYPYGDACIDQGGSLVCSIYKIIVQNTGSSAITVSGKLEFYGSSALDEEGKVTGPNEPTADEDGNVTAPAKSTNLMNHLKWARLVAPAGMEEDYTYDQATASTVMPTVLEDYSETEDTGVPYQTTPTETFYYANKNANKYLFAMKVTEDTNVDLLGGKTYTGKHGAYNDIIDPTNDLTITTGAEGAITAISETAVDDINGKWYLNANNQPGDTKVFYIVVWISENNQEQNEDDFGHFTGTVTFNSSGNSGATSTFTEAYRSTLTD